MNVSVQAFVSAAIQAAAEVYGISTEAITGERGLADDAWARQVAMYVCLRIGRLKSGAAAPYFDRAPCTLRYAHALVAERVRVYPEEMDRVSRVARLALERATSSMVEPHNILAPDDSAFVGYLTAVLTNPKYASDAVALREGRSCVTCGPGGALALHPFKGKP